jgi:hypothetical protein
MQAASIQEGSRDVYDRTAILNIVDDAERAHPLCTCGRPMIPEDREGALWLACSRPRPRRDGLLNRIRSLDWAVPHDRLLLVSAEELAA